MKLRIARKICKAIGTPDESRYTRHQTGKAMDRIEKTRSYRESERFVLTLMRRHPGAFKRPPICCLGCDTTVGVELECSRTAYPYDGQIGDANDPNNPIPLCRDCAKQHHEEWDDRWADYYGGLL